MPSLVTVVTTPSNHVNWDHDLLADNEPQVACWWGTMNCLLVRNYQLFVGEEPWTVCRRVRHTPFMRHSWLGYHTSTVSASSHPCPCIFTKWIITSSIQGFRAEWRHCQIRKKTHREICLCRRNCGQCSRLIRQASLINKPFTVLRFSMRRNQCDWSW